MDSVIKRMLVNVYELEGVLLLAQERGDATPETVLSIIKEKAELLLDDANSLNIFVETPDAENPQEPVEESFPETEEPLNEETATLDEPEVAESNEDETESEAFAAVASTMEKIKLFQEREQEEEEPQSFYYEAETEEEDVEPEVDDAEPVVEVEEEDPQQDADSDEAEREEIVVEDEIISEDEKPTFDNEEVVEVEEFEDIEEADENEDVASEETFEKNNPNINIEDAYIRHKSKDLRSAFSINDTFRFRRELFGNSAADMSDAINLVIAMNSYEEAEDYFYGDMKWDPESDEVKEFMEIIRNHFL